MDQILSKIDAGGRLLLPARIRKKMGISAGDEVALILEDSTLRVMTKSEAIRRAQRIVREYVAPHRRLSQELLAERREEASGE